MKLNFIFFLFFLNITSSWASRYLVNSIIIIGNNRTSQSVILNEIGFSKGDKISEVQILKAKENLQNLRLFSKVDLKVQTEESKEKIIINVIESWTTIPILKFSSGGGVTQTTIGIFDPNLFGEFLEAGAQYQRLEKTNSGVFWFKNPRLGGSQNGIDLQFWKINRLRTKFDQGARGPVVKTGFLQTRDKFYLGYTQKFSRSLKGILSYEYNSDKFSDKLVPVEAQNLISNEGLPPDSQVHFLGIGLENGKVNYESFLVDGSSLGVSYRFGLTTSKSLSNFSQIDFNENYYKTFFKDHTFAQRILAGATNTTVLQYWYYLGGLERIRGFSDNRFAGRLFWLSNTEYRIPILKKDSFVLQAVGFLDITTSTETFKGLGKVQGASTGAGLRIFLPKIYRFVVRLDYAKPIKREDNNNFSLGVQQFF